jgi:hypothetical protein
VLGNQVAIALRMGKTDELREILYETWALRKLLIGKFKSQVVTTPSIKDVPTWTANEWEELDESEKALWNNANGREVNEIELKGTRVHQCQTYPEMEELTKKKGQLFHSTKRTSPLFDGLSVIGDELVLFQVTFSPNHSMVETQLHTWSKKAEDAGLKLRFVFVGPEKYKFNRYLGRRYSLKAKEDTKMKKLTPFSCEFLELVVPLWY